MRGFIPLSHHWRSRSIHATVKKSMSAFDGSAKRTSLDQMDAIR
jgi:hypothetical protein